MLSLTGLEVQSVISAAMLLMWKLKHNIPLLSLSTFTFKLTHLACDVTLVVWLVHHHSNSMSHHYVSAMSPSVTMPLLLSWHAYTLSQKTRHYTFAKC